MIHEEQVTFMISVRAALVLPNLSSLISVSSAHDTIYEPLHVHSLLFTKTRDVRFNVDCDHRKKTEQWTAVICASLCHSENALFLLLWCFSDHFTTKNPVTVA
jgi:hypothetical protein